MTVIRYLLAFLLGMALYCWCYHPWLPYSMRERSMNGLGFAVLVLGALVGGAAFAWRTGGHRFRIAASLIGGLFVANSIVIAADWRVDPTDHNLFPFEFIILGIAGSPAFLGAAIAGRKPQSVKAG